MDIDAEPDDAVQTSAGPRTALRPVSPARAPKLAAIVEVLSVLARSASSQEEVFDAISERARRLCAADAAQIHLVQEGLSLRRSPEGLNPEYLRFARAHPVPRSTGHHWSAGSAGPSAQQITDVLADPEYRRPDLQRRAGYRTILGAPMLIGDDVWGPLGLA